MNNKLYIYIIINIFLIFQNQITAQSNSKNGEVSLPVTPSKTNEVTFMDGKKINFNDFYNAFKKSATEGGEMEYFANNGIDYCECILKELSEKYTFEELTFDYNFSQNSSTNNSEIALTMLQNPKVKDAAETCSKSIGFFNSNEKFSPNSKYMEVLILQCKNEMKSNLGLENYNDLLRQFDLDKYCKCYKTKIFNAYTINEIQNLNKSPSLKDIEMLEGFQDKCMLSSQKLDDTYAPDDGLQISYYSNGNIRAERNYLNGKRHGITTLYYENGNIKAKNEYKDDKWNGLVIGYSVNGIKVREISFKNEIKHGPAKGWYDNGKPEFEGNYIDGILDGQNKAWYDNGQLKWIENYILGKKNGIAKNWYQSGKIRAKGNFENDSGRLSFYLEDGTFQQTVYFKDGVPLE